MSRFNISPEEDSCSSNSNEYPYPDCPKKVPLGRWDCMLLMSKHVRNNSTVFSLNSLFLSSPPKPSLWPGGRESKLPPWTQPGQEEVWDWICKSISLTVSPHVNPLWCHFVLTPWTSHFPHSTRAMLPLACQSSTWETPSWAVASWVWPMPWPTPASPCLCTFFFINTLSSQLFLCEMESTNADVVEMRYPVTIQSYHRRRCVCGCVCSLCSRLTLSSRLQQGREFSNAHRYGLSICYHVCFR